ncbi:DUF433 domain-containing protein [candidate division KSB1 bacterium]|nr:DUF433 domain-containing protein [candidate division KSB1 bacterium]
MELSVGKYQPPFEYNSEGVVRIGGTRVTLETVINAFKNGSTCEEIVYQFPVLQLADVYSTISYYLNNQEIVESYLYERQLVAEKIEQDIRSHFDIRGIRERLSNRRKERK